MHLTDTVEGTDVSTIDLSISGMGRGFETCLFFQNGDSEVVGWYGTAEAAAEAHKAWLNPAVIGYVIGAVNRRNW